MKTVAMAVAATGAVISAASCWWLYSKMTMDGAAATLARYNYDPTILDGDLPGLGGRLVERASQETAELALALALAPSLIVAGAVLFAGGLCAFSSAGKTPTQNT